MMWLLLATALAQEPQEFLPLPYDAKVGGMTYSGILVDEKTYAELGELRALRKEHEAKLEAFSDWKTWEDAHRIQEVADLRASFDAGQVKLVDYYETQLKQEKQQGFLKQQGFTVGLVVGMLGATGVYLGAVRLYDVAIAN